MITVLLVVYIMLIVMAYMSLSVDILCKLVCGVFPGRHTSDYLSAEDLVKVRGRPRPHLSNVCRPASRTKIYVNIYVLFCEVSVLVSPTCIGWRVL